METKTQTTCQVTYSDANTNLTLSDINNQVWKFIDQIPKYYTLTGKPNYPSR